MVVTSKEKNYLVMGYVPSDVGSIGLKTIFHSNTRLYCVATYLVTTPLLASCACIGLHSGILLEVIGVKGYVHVQ